MLKSVGILASLTLLFAASLSAGDKKEPNNRGAIAGTFTDYDGARLVAAEIRVESVGKKVKPMITRTDSQGRYVVKGLPTGDYIVTAYIDGSPAYRAKIRTNDKGYAKVDFDGRLYKQGADGTDRMQRDLRNNNDSPLAGGRSGF